MVHSGFVSAPLNSSLRRPPGIRQMPYPTRLREQMGMGGCRRMLYRV